MTESNSYNFPKYPDKPIPNMTENFKTPLKDADTPEALTFNLSEFFELTRPTYQLRVKKAKNISLKHFS